MPEAHAFGIALDAAFEAPGIPAGAALEPLPATTVELVDRAVIEDRWRPLERDAERLLAEEFGGATPARTVDRHPDGGYRLYARHFGLARIATGGERVECAPPGVAAWRWQRFLVGRVLPWAALLRGREVFHASAVRIGDRIYGFVGPTGMGKTSLATRLVLRGAGFVTDDVLAIEVADGVVRGHPGACLVAVRPGERAVIDRPDWRRLGTVLGVSGKTYVQVEREHSALPLGGLFFLHRGTGGPAIEAGGVDARALLASTFVVSLAPPERLVRLLDLSATIQATVPLFRARVDDASGADALAEAVMEHVTGARLEAAA